MFLEKRRLETKNPSMKFGVGVVGCSRYQQYTLDLLVLSFVDDICDKGWQCQWPLMLVLIMYIGL